MKTLLNDAEFAILFDTLQRILPRSSIAQVVPNFVSSCNRARECSAPGKCSFSIALRCGGGGGGGGRLSFWGRG
ncbi:uncharacterized protein CTRU02_211879 [Colletotrichum truncatum]|uniref:Uncharacterized protein n=1 Tax=Colletotrichum truncatum TaxID=5467 RepID=A0ACC3YMG3_COLTU